MTADVESAMGLETESDRVSRREKELRDEERCLKEEKRRLVRESEEQS